MKILCLICIFSFNFLSASAIELPVLNDSVPVSKMSRQNFLDQYGRDDTSRATINYYFDTKRKLIKGSVTGAIISGAGGLVYHITVMKQRESNDLNNGGGVPLGILTGIALFLMIYVFGIKAIVYALGLLINPKTKLVKVLNTYFSGGGIPKRYKRSATFKKYLNGGK